MKIQKKLSLLFVAGALLPLIVVTFFHHTSMHQLGKEIAWFTQKMLASNERELLRNTVNDYGRILTRDRKALEMAVRLQAREVERYLAAPSPSSPDVHFPEEFTLDKKPEINKNLSSEESENIYNDKGPPVWINYHHQVFFLPKGVKRSDISNEISKLSKLVDTYQFINNLYPKLIYWQHTTLESGLHSSYPAHARFPSDYDPRKTSWYMKTMNNQSMTWSMAKTMANKTKTQMVAMPIHFPNGSTVGVTAIHVLFTSTFQALKLPESWEQHAATILVLFEPKKDSSGRLKVLVQENVQEFQGLFEKKSENYDIYLTNDGSQGFKNFLKDASEGKSGIQKVSYKGQDLLYAYGIHEIGEPFPLIILPYEQVTNQATELRELVQEKTDKWLQLTGIVLIGAGFLSFFLAFISANSVITPVMELSGAAKRMAHGDYQSKVEINSKDEFGELGQIFNEMGPKLQESERMRHALAVAKETQQYLLPKSAPKLKHFDICGTSIYSDETGGDYYDFIELLDNGTDKLGIAVGDVSGHGIGPALLMASARGVIRSNASCYSDNLIRLFEMLNYHLVRDTGDSQFLTLFYGILDAENKSLTWISAGHDPALRLVFRTGEIQELANTGMPLGISKEATYEQSGPLVMENNDLIIIGTDGIRETRNPKGEMFGRERLGQLLRTYSYLRTRDLCKKVIDVLTEFREDTPQEDDLTMVIIKFQPDED